jgi:hypothetical protein
LTDDVRAERVQAYLDRLAAGEPADTLRAVDADAGDLALARLAQQLGAVLPARPPAAFRARLQADLQVELARRNVPPAPRGVRFGRRLWVRLGAAALAVVLVFASAVGASASSLPGDALYGLKRAVESTRVHMAWNAAARVAVELDIAEARLREIAAFRARARPVPPQLAAEVAMAHVAAQTAAAGSGQPDLAAVVRTAVAHDEAELRQMLSALAPAVVPTASPTVPAPPATATRLPPNPTAAPATATPRRVVRPTPASTQDRVPTPLPPTGATEPSSGRDRPVAPTAAPVSLATPTLSDRERLATERANDVPTVAPTLSNRERLATERAEHPAGTATPRPTRPVWTPRPPRGEPTRLPGHGEPRPTVWPPPTRHP